jgi:hypothetical protein
LLNLIDGAVGRKEELVSLNRCLAAIKFNGCHRGKRESTTTVRRSIEGGLAARCVKVFSIIPLPPFHQSAMQGNGYGPG